MQQWKVTYKTEQSSYYATAFNVLIIAADTEDDAIKVARDHHWRRYGRDNFYHAGAKLYDAPVGRVIQVGE